MDSWQSKHVSTSRTGKYVDSRLDAQVIFLDCDMRHDPSEPKIVKLAGLPEGKSHKSLVNCHGASVDSRWPISTYRVFSGEAIVHAIQALQSSTARMGESKVLRHNKNLPYQSNVYTLSGGQNSPTKVSQTRLLSPESTYPTGVCTSCGAVLTLVNALATRAKRAMIYWSKIEFPVR